MLTTSEWLPVGSVVHVEGLEDKVTIMGYYQQDVETGRLWDYFGLRHPSGFLEPGHDVLFDRDAIDAVLYVGYQSFDWERMKDALDAAQEAYLAEKERAARQAAERTGPTADAEKDDESEGL